MTLHRDFLKREWQDRLPRKLISPCIREALEPIWSRIWHSAYHRYSITDTLIHLQLEACMAGIHIREGSLCSSVLRHSLEWALKTLHLSNAFKETVPGVKGPCYSKPTACCLQPPAGRPWGAQWAQGLCAWKGACFKLLSSWTWGWPA